MRAKFKNVVHGCPLWWWLQQSTADPRLVLKGIAVLLSFTMGPLPGHEMKKLIWPTSLLVATYYVVGLGSR